jgi:hypothetical protein
MHTQTVLAVTLGALLTATCAKRVPEPPNVAPGTPHVSWVIMSGDRENADREFVCQSDPRNDCVMPASRANEQAFADVHVYYHGVGAETKYQGTVAIGFLEGAAAASTAPTNIVVKKDESIANQSVTGIVTSKPGTYAVAFELTATVTDAGKIQPVRQSVRVVVQ